MGIIIQQGDITNISTEAIVNPANSFGFMGGGVAGALKRAGGSDIEQEAIQQAPIPVGAAVATTAGSLNASYVIHAPTMHRPAMRIGSDNVKKATHAALKLAQKMGIKRIALPGMGTGVGRVLVNDAAQEIITVAQEFADHFDEILLIDRNSAMIAAFHRFLSQD